MGSGRCVQMCSITGKAFCSGKGMSKLQCVLLAFWDFWDFFLGLLLLVYLINATVFRYFAVYVGF